MRDYYKILGVNESVNSADLKKAYRKLAMKYHPDRNTNDPKTAEGHFKEVKEAYEVLSDSQKRSDYDQFGHDGVNSQNGFSGGFSGGFEDIFENVFGGRRQSAQRGDNLAYQMELTLEEAAFGVKKEIIIPKKESCGECGGTGAKKGTNVSTCTQCGGHGQVIIQQGFMQVQQPCPSCHGSGQHIKEPCYKCHATGLAQKNKTLSVTIPAGVETGDRIRLQGEGEAGANGASSGDLLVQVSVKSHSIFTQDGQDLHCDVPISFATASLGGTIKVPTLMGHVNLKVPAETQSHKVFRLRSKGMTSAKHGGMGNLYCRLAVETPVKLSNKQKNLLREFDEVLHGSKKTKHNPKGSSWRDKVKSFIDGL